MTDALKGLILDVGGVLTDGPPVTHLPARARAAGIRTALLTDASSVAPELAALVDVVRLGSDGPRKPHPDAFRAAAAALGVPVEQCVVVDDAEANVRGAREAGAVVVRHADAETTVLEVEILLDLHPEHRRN
ncbi:MULTISPECIES: HAD-IA family hydrolase [unclassified Pseudonocardia]|uniref:HAD-IA family hydrolase n=1 Tax=unclassified Pseudonocardia TaxID=2619320 RepID=UPI0025EC8502|nr:MULTISPECIES: HAD-IA family hydrolase [unclassified Pseudonocardia]